MRLLLITGIFLFVTFNIFPSGARDTMNTTKTTNQSCSSSTSSAVSENTFKITGRVQVYGNEPNTFAGIVDQNGTEYAIYPPAQEARLRALQGHLIEFTVLPVTEPKSYGSLFLKGGTVEPITWEIIR